MIEKFVSELRNKRIAKLALLTLVIIGVFLAVFLVFSKEPEPTGEFDKERSSDDLKTKEVYWLNGPFAEYEDNNVITAEYYIAVAEDEIFVLSTGRYNDTEIPIYGEDIMGDEIDSAEPVLIQGKGEYIEGDLRTYSAEYYNEVSGEEILTADNLDTVFGAYYLDTTNKGNNEALNMWLFIGIILIVFLIIFAAVSFKDNKTLIKDLRAYEEKGQLTTCEEDFLNAKNNYDKKLKIVLSDRYLYNFKTNLYIIPLNEIINVYGCCIINNKIQNQEFIAIETKNDAVYYIAPKAREKNNRAVDALRENLRQKAKENSDDYLI